MRTNFSDSYNKEVALARIKRICNLGLPVEPFARSVFEHLHSAIPFSPNKSMLVAGHGGADSFVASTPETVAVIPRSSIFLSSGRLLPVLALPGFPYDTAILPQQTVWRHEEIARPDILKMEGFNEVMRPIGWRHLLQIVFVEDGRFVGYAPPWRSEGEKNYTRADEDFLRAASPHVTHGLKVAQLQRNTPPGDQSFSPLTDWNPGSVLLDRNAHPIAMDAQARLIFQQIAGLDGVGADAFHLPQIHNAFVYVAATLNDIFHDPASGLTDAAPPVARVYAHWSGIILKRSGLRMIAADGREYTTVLVERGETAESRRRRMLARWGLSQREAEVLDLICDGKTGPEIAILLSLSHDTVRKHTSSILAKLGVETRAAATTMVRDFN